MKKINRGFKLPEEHYFSDFDQKIQERLKWSSKDDFRMPEHYFEELHQNILMSLAKKRRNKVVSLIRQSVATAAAISLLVVMYATSFSNEMNQNMSDKTNFHPCQNSDYMRDLINHQVEVQLK